MSGYATSLDRCFIDEECPCLARIKAPDVAPADRFVRVAEASFRSVGICILLASQGCLIHPLTRTAVAPRRRRMRNAGIGGHDVELVLLMPGCNVEALVATLGPAAGLGVRRLDVSGDDENRARLAERFGRPCDMGAGAGLGLLLHAAFLHRDGGFARHRLQPQQALLAQTLDHRIATGEAVQHVVPRARCTVASGEIASRRSARGRRFTRLVAPSKAAQRTRSWKAKCCYPALVRSWSSNEL